MKSIKKSSIVNDIKHPDPDFISITEKYEIEIEFDDNMNNYTRKLSNFKIPEDEINNRKDLRNLFTITMDSINAKDFDDAYSLTYNNGIWNLWVHIADVSYFVKKDSEIDKEALKRGNSYYLGPWVVHMLPSILSENLCSLKEGEDRLTVTCEIKLDKDGKLIDYDIYRSVIRVDKRIPYEIGNEILKDESNEYFKFLKLSQDLQTILYNNRIKDGSLNFDFPDYIFLFNNSYITPTDIIRYERGICERIIEEFMLCANRIIATEGSKLKSFIFRIHDKPENNNNAKSNFHLPDKLSHKEINEFLKNYKNTDKQFAIETMILKSLKRANYDNKNIGHFGLNFEKYTHFTSPIRRYADLIAHRIILGEKYNQEELKKISVLTSIKEQVATYAEEDYNKIKNAYFLKKFVNQKFNVSVVGFIPKGIFCRIDRYGCEGLLSSKLLKEKGYNYNKKSNLYESKNRKKSIGLGSILELYLIKSDANKGFIDFGFQKMEKGKKGEKKSKKRRHSSRHDSFN